MLEKTPATAALTRMSDEAQLRRVQGKLDKLGVIAKVPVHVKASKSIRGVDGSMNAKR